MLNCQKKVFPSSQMVNEERKHNQFHKFLSRFLLLFPSRFFTVVVLLSPNCHLISAFSLFSFGSTTNKIILFFFHTLTLARDNKKNGKQILKHWSSWGFSGKTYCGCFCPLNSIKNKNSLELQWFPTLWDLKYRHTTSFFPLLALALIQKTYCLRKDFHPLHYLALNIFLLLTMFRPTTTEINIRNKSGGGVRTKKYQESFLLSP